MVFIDIVDALIFAFIPSSAFHCRIHLIFHITVKEKLHILHELVFPTTRIVVFSILGSVDPCEATAKSCVLATDASLFALPTLVTPFSRCDVGHSIRSLRLFGQLAVKPAQESLGVQHAYRAC